MRLAQLVLLHSQKQMQQYMRDKPEAVVVVMVVVMFMVVVEVVVTVVVKDIVVKGLSKIPFLTRSQKGMQKLKRTKVVKHEENKCYRCGGKGH